MNYHVYSNLESLSHAAAAIFVSQISQKPNSVLGLATGSTPLPIYKKLIELNKNGVLDFSQTITYNLDEYIGLDKSHDQSYYEFMQQNLFKNINIKQDNINILNGVANNLEQECIDFENAINNDGGIDLQLLGIGNNAHIAFNEPSTFFTDTTGIIELTESTINANKRFFEKADDVPRKALSTGIGTIMRAKSIMLIATGESKAQAVYDMINGPITPDCPASVLRLHPRVTILLDEAAASKL